jgi:hypothetical protein
MNLAAKVFMRRRLSLTPVGFNVAERRPGGWGYAEKINLK